MCIRDRIDRVDLADRAVLAGGQGRFVVLGAVDDAGLQRGVDIAVGHGLSLIHI